MSKTFSQVTETNQQTVMIVDCLNLAFRWKHSGDTDFLDSYRKTIESLRRSYNCGKVILTCDSGSSSYRKELYPEYKQNRKDKFELQTPEEALAFERFFTEFNRVMQYYKDESDYPLFRFEKCEADDIAAYIVKNRQHYGIENIVLVSSDRDWDLLVAPDVMRFSYVTRKEVTHDNWTEHYDCDPEEYISIKCLQGDTGDNIPGVPGIGPKKAYALVKEYGSCYDIIANLPIASRYKYIQNLNEFGSAKLMMNYQLMDLLEFCDTALGESNCNTIDKTLEIYVFTD
jgi:DNA polymerase-1